MAFIAQRMSDGRGALALAVETSRGVWMTSGSRIKRLDPIAQPLPERLGRSKLGFGGSIAVDQSSWFEAPCWISGPQGLSTGSRTIAAESR